MTRIVRALTFLGLTLALACGGAADGTDTTDEGTEGGEDLASYEGPVGGDAMAGEAVFANNCAGCHPGVGPDLQGHMASPAATRMIIRNGEDRMPAFGPDKISDEDLENVLAHLQANYAMYQ
jgi:mono/diheme cytochrome c family protein